MGASERGRDWLEERASLLTAAGDLGAVGRDAVRVADLLLARAMAGHLELLQELSGGTRLEQELREVALEPLHRLGRGQRKRSAAVEAAHRCARRVKSENAFHLWSESSQAGDPGRKGRGAFSTPPSLGAVMVARGLDRVDVAAGELPLTIDPSAGHGALLLSMLEALIEREVLPSVAVKALHGVELDSHARELCCLSLWLRAGDSRVELGQIASRIVLGNALTANWVAEAESFDEADEDTQQTPNFVWEAAFPAVFADGGFDLVLANPPWESLRHVHAEDPTDWMQRQATRSRLARETDTGRGLPPLYSAQGRGDRNLYKGFAELFPHLLSPEGRLVALLPGAFSSDFGMREIRQRYLRCMSLERWTGFENLGGYFPIDGRYKFGILSAARSEAGTSDFKVRFMARDAREATARNGHMVLSRRQVGTLGGPSTMFPEVSDHRQLAILERAFNHGSPFFDPTGSLGAISYRREVDLTTDRRAGRFVHVDEAHRQNFRPGRTGVWSDGSRKLVPLVEGRMVSSWDFFEKSWLSGSGRSARWRTNDIPLSDCRPQFLAPRQRLDEFRLAFCDVTSATNTRTMRASWVPSWPCGNTAPVLSAESVVHSLALLAVLNSMTFDWLLRRLAAGLHLNRFYLEATPLPRISESDVREVASFAAVTMLTGRCRGLAPSELVELKRIAGSSPKPPSPAQVEAIVAAGYGLGASHLRQVMDSNRDDRKGLWRFFAANPGALEIAEEGIEVLASR